MIYDLTSVNSTLIKVAHIISDSSSNDSHYTAWIGIIGVLLSVSISTIVTLIIHNKAESENSNRVHRTLRNASNNTGKQIENSNNNLRKKLVQNREDIYNNSLRIYIYKKIDVMIDKIIDIMAKSIKLNKCVKSLIYFNSYKDVNFLIHSYIKLLYSSDIVYGFVYKFIIIKHSLKGLNRDSSDDRQLNNIINDLNRLSGHLVKGYKELNLNKISKVNKIFINTNIITKLCESISINMSTVNELHSLREDHTNVGNDLGNHMSQNVSH